VIEVGRVSDPPFPIRSLVPNLGGSKTRSTPQSRLLSSSVFSLHRPRDRTRAREARNRGASPREGTTFAASKSEAASRLNSKSEGKHSGPSATASQPRFERGIVLVQLQPDPPISLRVAEKLRPPPSKRIDAGANPAAGTMESKPAEARTLFRRSEAEMDRLKVDPAGASAASQNRWTGQIGWGARPLLCSRCCPLRGHPHRSPLTSFGAAPSPRCRAPSANFSSCSSKAEPSADNRSNAERYRARGPVFARREAAAEDCRAIARVQRATAG
jgi:hypothetical protein